MKNLLKNNIVNWGILAITTGVFIADTIKNGFLSSYANSILPILIVYQIRGILWNTGMLNKIGDLEKELKECK